MLRGSKKFRARRRSYGIRGYVGPNGAGKSLGAVFDLLPSLDLGRPILSTVRFLDYRNPRPCEDPACTWPGHPDHAAAHPSWIWLRDWQQFLDFRDGDIFLDEVAGVASSRESSNLPFQVARDLQQLRKRNCTLSWTAPNFQRADRIIRECTQLVVECRGFWKKIVVDSDRAMLWPDSRLIRWVAYDAASYEAWSEGTRDKANRLHSTWLHRRDGCEAQDAYDTRDSVSSVGWALSSGMCLACGGRRTPPRCKCEQPKMGGHAHAEGEHGPLILAESLTRRGSTTAE